MREIPEGFILLLRPSPFLQMLGPLYIKGEGATATIGLRIEEKHINAGSIAHGGVLASFADMALGYALVFSTNPPRRLVTMNLNVDYIGKAQVGDLLEARVEIHKKQGRTAFASAYLFIGETLITRASGIFLMGEPFDPTTQAADQA